MTIPLWGKNLVGFAAVHDKVRVCRSNSSALRTFLSLDLSLGSVFRRNRAGGAPPAAASGPRAPPQPRPQRPRCAGPPPGAAAGPLPGPRRPVPRGGRARRRLEALLPSSPPPLPPSLRSPPPPQPRSCPQRGGDGGEGERRRPLEIKRPRYELGSGLREGREGGREGGGPPPSPARRPAGAAPPRSGHTHTIHTPYTHSHHTHTPQTPHTHREQAAGAGRPAAGGGGRVGGAGR